MFATMLVVIQLAEVEDEAEFCIRQVRGDEFACRRVMTDKIVDGHAEVIREAYPRLTRAHRPGSS